MRYIIGFLLVGCTMLTPKFGEEIWLHDQIPAEVCVGKITEYGIYRKLKTGKVQYLSYCSPEITKYLSSHVDDIDLEEK